MEKLETEEGVPRLNLIPRLDSSTVCPGSMPKVLREATVFSASCFPWWPWAGWDMNIFPQIQILFFKQGPFHRAIYPPVSFNLHSCLMNPHGIMSFWLSHS